MTNKAQPPSPEQKFIASYIENKLVEYVNKRGIPMPFYTNGSKITEEAQELRDALVSYLANRSEGNLAALKEEVADVVITAAVAARQAKFTVEEALDAKIAKDTNRGEKMAKQDPISQLPEFARKVANGDLDVTSVLDFVTKSLGSVLNPEQEKTSDAWTSATDKPEAAKAPERKVAAEVKDFIELAKKALANIDFIYEGKDYSGLPIEFVEGPDGELTYVRIADLEGKVKMFELALIKEVGFVTRKKAEEPVKASKVTVTKFKVGDKVVKPEGYEFPATIVSVFEKTTGEVRVVAEDDRGMLHIFNEGQLEHAEQ